MISYRRVLPAEAAAVAGHLKRLSPAQRQTRFFHYVGDDSIDRYVDGITWSRAVVVGAFDEGHLRGVAEVMQGVGCAELAVSVETDWQGLHRATELTRRALLAARNRSFGDVSVRFLRENGPMKGIARRFGGGVRYEEGELVSEIHMDAATPQTMSEEMAGEGLGWIGDFPDRSAAMTPGM